MKSPLTPFKRISAVTLCRRARHRLASGGKAVHSQPPLRKFFICLALCLTVAPVQYGVEANPASDSLDLKALPLAKFLWRDVKIQNGEVVGAIRDVLVHMPSGKIVFVLVEPADLFGRAKVIRPDLLSVSENPTEPVVLNQTLEDWLNAPRLDWSGALVTRRTNAGETTEGVYQREWAEQRPAPPTKRSAAPSPAPPPQSAVGFVSLEKLRLKPAMLPGWDQNGFLNGFLLDWTSTRVTHALISPEFAPIAPPNELWYAVPLTMINPPNEQNTLTVNSSPEAISRVARASGDRLRSDIAGIYQFPPAWLGTVAYAAE